MERTVIVPRLFIKSRGESTTKLSLKLSTAPRHCVVRITGGCGKMSPEDAEGLYEVFMSAFHGYDGAMLFGGTRMLAREDRETIIPGITEIPARLRSTCPKMVTLGVIPRTQDLQITDHGMVVSDKSNCPYFTIIHPEQDMALLVQVSADDPEIWDAEYQECLRITADLRDYAERKSILVSYNGGTVTEREILAVSERGWPVILIQGSGRKTDEYASNVNFLRAHPHVKVAQKDADSLRDCLAFFGAVQPRKLTLVRSTGAA